MHDLTGWGIAIDTPTGALTGLRAVENCFERVRQPAILNTRYLDDNSGNGAACGAGTLPQALPR
jgi:hypothetical protein